MSSSLARDRHSEDELSQLATFPTFGASSSDQYISDYNIWGIGGPHHSMPLESYGHLIEWGDVKAQALVQMGEPALYNWIVSIRSSLALMT
jgi:hypothetical protein